MIAKKEEKRLAIKLRQAGLTYSEILAQVPVAKSTLSLWLKCVGLNKGQKQRITKKRLDAAKRGGVVKRNQRIAITNQIKSAARKEINDISNRELWLMGIILYWAEGSKEKEWGRSQQVELINSDPFIIKFFLKWLLKHAGVKRNEIYFQIYIHKNYKKSLLNVKKYWSGVTGYKLSNFRKIYFKKHKVKSVRYNINDNYKGILNVRVRSSSSLNRKIAGWIERIDDII